MGPNRLVSIQDVISEGYFGTVDIPTVESLRQSMMAEKKDVIEIYSYEQDKNLYYSTPAILKDFIEVKTKKRKKSRKNRSNESSRKWNAYGPKSYNRVYHLLNSPGSTGRVIRSYAAEQVGNLLVALNFMEHNQLA